jgi:hypothetical protein
MNEEDELTQEEKEVGARFFFWVHKISLVLPLMAVGLQIYFGFKTYPIWLCVPLWAAFWFAIKTFRRILFNIWYETYLELGWVEDGDENAQTDENLYDISAEKAFPRGFTLPSKLRAFTRNQIVLVACVLLTVSLFWYGLGTFARWVST